MGARKTPFLNESGVRWASLRRFSGRGEDMKSMLRSLARTMSTVTHHALTPVSTQGTFAPSPSPSLTPSSRPVRHRALLPGGQGR